MYLVKLARFVNEEEQKQIMKELNAIQDPFATERRLLTEKKPEKASFGHLKRG